jgi:prophage antirepressor-like protein
MSDLSIFSFKSQDVRIVIIDDEPWFVAKDVFDVLDVAWTGGQSLSKIKNEWKKRESLNLSTDVSKPHQELADRTTLVLKDTWFINEPAVYKIIFRSNKSSAEQFTDWIAGEVLPSIRKTGSYSLVKENTKLKGGVEELQDIIVDMQNTIDVLKEEILRLRLQIINCPDQEKPIYELLLSLMDLYPDKWIDQHDVLETCLGTYSREDLGIALGMLVNAHKALLKRESNNKGIAFKKNANNLHSPVDRCENLG